MPEFILDTDGEVHIPTGVPRHGQRIAFNDLDSFTQGYIEALFFTNIEPSTTRDDHSEDDAREGRISELPGDYGFSDLAPETLHDIIDDCYAFQCAAAYILAGVYESDIDYSPEQAGRDYWFTRNGCGVGYWDRNQLEANGIGEKLSELCRYSPVDVYRGDNGLVYLS